MAQYKIGVNNEIKISADRTVIYTISDQHRGRHRQNKSKWILTMPQEISLFKTALKNGYEDKLTHTAWNLYTDANNKICVLGQSADLQELKIAKFVDSDHKDWWHGYPAHYVKNIQDIPPIIVLLSWEQAGYISTATMKRIKGGQPCNL